LDALGFLNETLPWVTFAWNRLGRTDLTAEIMGEWLEQYFAAVLG
jgi:hypothetical protein